MDPFTSNGSSKSTASKWDATRYARSHERIIAQLNDDETAPYPIVACKAILEIITRTDDDGDEEETTTAASKVPEVFGLCAIVESCSLLDISGTTIGLRVYDPTSAGGDSTSNVTVPVCLENFQQSLPQPKYGDVVFLPCGRVDVCNVFEKENLNQHLMVIVDASNAPIVIEEGFLKPPTTPELSVDENRLANYPWLSSCFQNLDHFLVEQFLQNNLSTLALNENQEPIERNFVAQLVGLRADLIESADEEVHDGSSNCYRIYVWDTFQPSVCTIDPTLVSIESLRDLGDIDLAWYLPAKFGLPLTEIQVYGDFPVLGDVLKTVKSNLWSGEPVICLFKRVHVLVDELDFTISTSEGTSALRYHKLIMRGSSETNFPSEILPLASDSLLRKTFLRLLSNSVTRFRSTERQEIRSLEEAHELFLPVKQSLLDSVDRLLASSDPIPDSQDSGVTIRSADSPIPTIGSQDLSEDSAMGYSIRHDESSTFSH